MGNRDLEKAFKDGYEEIYGRPTPIRYDVLRLSEEHRKLDALFRRYYDTLHPMVKDLFTSFALEFKYLISELEKLEGEHSTIREEYEVKKAELDDGMNERLVELTKEIEDFRRRLKNVTEDKNKLLEKVDYLKEDLEAKEELIVTQRNELDNLIEESTRLENLKSEQEETIHGTIEHVSKFTTRLETIEKEMQLLENQKSRLEKENKILQTQLRATEDQYLSQIEEMTNFNRNLKKNMKQLTQDVNELRKENSKIKEKLKIQANDEENFNFRLSQLISQIKELKKENQNLKEIVEAKDLKLTRINEKYKDFQNLANKLIKYRDQISVQPEIDKRNFQEEKQKARSLDQVKGWESKSKTSLEMELEKETIKSVKSGASTIEHENLDTIEKRLKEEDREIQKIRKTMKSSKPNKIQLVQEPVGEITDKKENFEIDEAIKEHSAKIGDPFKKMEATLSQNKTLDKTSSSFEKMINHLNKTDVTTLEKFVEEFPTPPKDKKITKKTSKKQKERTIKQ